MDPKNQKKLPQTIFATILLAFIFTVLCFIAGVVMVAINWNNPIWDLRVKLILLGVLAVVLVAGIFLGNFLRKKMQ